MYWVGVLLLKDWNKAWWLFSPKETSWLFPDILDKELTHIAQELSENVIDKKIFKNRTKNKTKIIPKAKTMYTLAKCLTESFTAIYKSTYFPRPSMPN